MGSATPHHGGLALAQCETRARATAAQGGTKSIESSTDQRHRGFEQIMADLFPLGPTDQDIWLRAGGDVSRLKLSGSGRAQWFAALRLISLGGGGSISRESLIDPVLDEFPAHRELKALR